MIIAEIQSKLNYVDFSDEALSEQATTQDILLTRKEDVLTSNVFGILKNIDITIFNALLREAGIEALHGEPEFIFWPRYEDNTEPDLIVKTPTQYLIIEVKYLSDFDKGTNDKFPQLLREIYGAQKDRSSSDQQIIFLGITREETINWTTKIFLKPTYSDELKKYEPILHHLSWKKIYETLYQQLKVHQQEKEHTVSKAFLADLVAYLETKEIGYIQENYREGKRQFEYIFGQESHELVDFLEKYGYKLNLSNLAFEIKKELYDTIQRYIEEITKNNKLRKVNNTLAIEKIPVDVLFGLEKEEIKIWSSFITFLFTNDFVNMNGQSDFSIKLYFKKGNYTQSPISLFRYRKNSRIIEFQKNR